MYLDVRQTNCALQVELGWVSFTSHPLPLPLPIPSLPLPSLSNLLHTLPHPAPLPPPRPRLAWEVAPPLSR